MFQIQIHVSFEQTKNGFYIFKCITLGVDPEQNIAPQTKMFMLYKAKDYENS